MDEERVMDLMEQNDIIALFSQSFLACVGSLAYCEAYSFSFEEALLSVPARLSERCSALLKWNDGL